MFKIECNGIDVGIEFTTEQDACLALTRRGFVLVQMHNAYYERKVDGAIERARVIEVVDDGSSLEPNEAYL